MKKSKKIIVLGGDGYLGWPVAMFLSKNNYDVLIIDDYSKRKICKKLGIKSLCPVKKLDKRVSSWNKISKNKIKYEIQNLRDYEKSKPIFNKFQPETVIHLAEQPSAPYSMMSYEAASFTLKNNLETTLNLAYLVNNLDTKAHIIKLGTMGEYGTPNIDIEEGFINIRHKNREDKFLFHRKGGSLYHTTKIQDTDLLYFYARAWQLRVTDLMQGPVYGLHTRETKFHQNLWTSFFYDGIFGTVLNRFVVQAIAGFPLTVYGKGNQRRGYLNILDTLECIKIAIESPPKVGELKIFNQFTEVFTVNELAEKVLKSAKNIGLKNLKIKKIINPRVEMEDHYYNPVCENFKNLGLKANRLSDNYLENLIEELLIYKSKINHSEILPNIKWK